MSPPDGRVAAHLARLSCIRCDARGFVWRSFDGSEVLPDDPRGVTAARCRHPDTHRVASSLPDGHRLDELSDEELAALADLEELEHV